MTIRKLEESPEAEMNLNSVQEPLMRLKLQSYDYQLFLVSNQPNIAKRKSSGISNTQKSMILCTVNFC